MACIDKIFMTICIAAQGPFTSLCGDLQSSGCGMKKEAVVKVQFLQISAMMVFVFNCLVILVHMFASFLTPVHHQIF